MPARQRGAAWSEKRLLGALRQSVPQNGRVHLHIIDYQQQNKGAGRTRGRRIGPEWCSVPSIGVIGKSALEIGQLLRRTFWMISWGPFLSRPLCFTTDLSEATPAEPRGEKKKNLVFVQILGGEKLLEKCR